MSVPLIIAMTVSVSDHFIRNSPRCGTYIYVYTCSIQCLAPIVPQALDFALMHYLYPTGLPISALICVGVNAYILAGLLLPVLRYNTKLGS